MEKRELVDRKYTKIFGGRGDKNRADKLIEWSKKSPTGKRLNHELSGGLSLAVIANGGSPSIEVYFNPKRFQELAKSLGSDLFVLSTWGMVLEFRDPDVNLRLITVKGPQLFLWRSADADRATMMKDDVKHLVGILRLPEDEACPTFWPAEEKKAMKEIVKPLLVVPAGEAIPPQSPPQVDMNNPLIRAAAREIAKRLVVGK